MIQDWLKNNVTGVAESLMDLNRFSGENAPIGGFGMKSRIVRFINLVRTAMYPHIYQDRVSRPEFLETVVSDCLNQAAMLLFEMCCDVQCVTCTQEQKDSCGEDRCRAGASEVTEAFMGSLPEIARVLRSDIRAAYEGDPAAKSEEEILLAYPTFEAISIHRLAHRLYELQVPMLPRMMSEYAHQITGIDIHPGATIGRRVKLYQGVTLGAKSFPVGEDGILVKGIKRHPDIGDDVVIYAGATILGGNTRIGNRCVIGGNVWLTHSVQDGETVYYK